MNILIEAPFDLNEREEQMIREKCQGLLPLEPKMTEATIYFKTKDTDFEEELLAQIRLRIPGQDIFADGSDKDLTKAFNETYATVKRMLVKRKEQMKDHHVRWPHKP